MFAVTSWSAAGFTLAGSFIIGFGFALGQSICGKIFGGGGK